MRATDDVKQLHGPGDVEGIVFLAGTAENPVPGGHHQVDHFLAARYLIGHGGARDSHPAAQIGRIGVLHPLAEYLGDTLCGQDQASGDLEQSRLAGAVRADDHPALAVAHGPADVLEQHRLIPADPHGVQPQHLSRHLPPPASRSERRTCRTVPAGHDSGCGLHAATSSPAPACFCGRSGQPTWSPMIAIAEVGKSTEPPVRISVTSAAAGLCPTYMRQRTWERVSPKISKRSSASASYSRGSLITWGSPPISALTYCQVCLARRALEQSTRSGTSSCPASHCPAAVAFLLPLGRRARSMSGPPGSSPALACRMMMSCRRAVIASMLPGRAAWAKAG